MALPFRVGETVHELGQFNDRAGEVTRVRQVIRQRERLLVYGERRIGKTSILRRAADRERAEQNATVLWLDLWSLTAVADVLRAVLHSIPLGWAPKPRLLTLLAGADVRPQLTGSPASGEGGISLGWQSRDLNDARARTLLKATFEALDQIAATHPNPIAILIDEFQQVEQITKRGGAYLRSVIQDTGHLGYVLAGSTLSLVDNLTSPRGPFYNIPRMDVGAIDQDIMGPWIEDQMRTNGVSPDKGLGRLILDRVGPGTEARVRLARETFLLALPAGVARADTVDGAFQSVVGSMMSAYESMWNRLAEGQRRAMQILANVERHPTSGSTLRLYGLATSATFVRAVEALRGQALLTAKDPVAIADPFFAAWILQNTVPPVAANSAVET